LKADLWSVNPLSNAEARRKSGPTRRLRLCGRLPYLTGCHSNVRWATTRPVTKGKANGGRAPLLNLSAPPPLEEEIVQWPWNQQRGPDREKSRKYLSCGEKIVKIGPVDPEIICLKLKKEEIKLINASKIYSPVGKFAEQAKWDHLV